MFLQILIYGLFLNACHCVPPSPTDSLLNDVREIKVFVASVTNLLSQNEVNKRDMEKKLVQSNNALISIDSNVKNLQERAHVWDTFQLHVSAWNDQLSTTDRKLDILSKAQEKFYNLDAKLNNIPNLEYKLDSVLKKLQETDEFLHEINKKLDERRHGESLFGEFATRGILSTLKAVEKKLDRLHLSGLNGNTKQLKQDEAKAKTKCNIQPLDEILRDVSSKVDVIFDKFSEKDEVIEEEYFDESQVGSGEMSDDNRRDFDLKLFRKVLKRLHEPCKQSNKMLENVLGRIKSVENNTNTIIKKNGRACKTNGFDLLSNITEIGYNQKEVIAKHFIEQRKFLENSLKLYLKCNVSPSDNSNLFPTTFEDDSSTTEITTTAPIKVTTVLPQDFPPHKNKTEEDPEDFTLCFSLLGSLIPNGIVSFFEPYLNTIGRDYNTRYCENGWTVIQRRDTYETQENFNRSWHDYKYGFGQLGQDFWFGNEFISKLSLKNDLLLRIELEDFEYNSVWAEYKTFRVYSEADNYRLSIGGYSGTASDSFSSHNMSMFSTYDRKNDEAPECCPCALSYGGGWWFNSCFEANLNGIYYRTPNTNEYYRGIVWEHWLGNYSLKKTKMMVKPMDDVRVQPFEILNAQSKKDLIPFEPIEDP